MNQIAVVKRPDTIQFPPRENNGDSLDGLREETRWSPIRPSHRLWGRHTFDRDFNYSPHAQNATIFRLVCIVFRSDTVEASW